MLLLYTNITYYKGILSTFESNITLFPFLKFSLGTGKKLLECNLKDIKGMKTY
jgi:hypothetical protein